jgi:hypothetical protein
VRNERSLCAHRVPKICAKTSITICMGSESGTERYVAEYALLSLE